jgi:hypothetical protein
VRLGGVLDDPQAVLPSQVEDRFHVDAAPIEMDGQDRSRAIGHRLCCALRIHQPIVVPDVDEDRG